MSVSMSRTFDIKKRMEKVKSTTILIDLEEFNVLIAKIVVIFKLKAKVFQGNKEESLMSGMMMKVKMIREIKVFLSKICILVGNQIQRKCVLLLFKNQNVEY